MQDSTNWEVIKPIENSSNNTSFFYDYYGLHTYFSKSDDGKTIKIDMQKSLLTDKSYQAQIYNYVDNWLTCLTGGHDSVSYNQFMMIFSVVAKKPIRLQKIETIPFSLKVLGELIKDGWSKAAWYDYPFIYNTLQIFKDQYPECRKVIIEPPVFVSFQKGIDVVNFFGNEDIELTGIVN